MDVLDNRELSWIAFNERVLAQADRDDIPLLERMRFAAIYASNLEEFFMVRGGVLQNRRLAGDELLDPRTRLSPSGQLTRIYAEVRRLAERQSIYLSRIESELAARGVRRLRPEELDGAQKAIADIFFNESIKPALSRSPEGDEAAPFIAGGRLCAACLKADGTLSFAVSSAEIPPLAALPCSDGFAYILTEDLLSARAGELFPNAAECAVISVTRSADVSLEELPLGEMPVTDAIRQAVSLRDALPAVRLRISGGVSEAFRAALASHFGLADDQLFTCGSPLDMRCVSALAEALGSRAELFYKPFSPKERTVTLDGVIEGDVLLSYPYESFGSFLRLLDEAAADERVTAIKITLYRTAHGSRVIEALCQAARNGKAVTVCVELKARFDERHNIACAEKLRAAGCNVIYGFCGVKVHSKLCLITLKTGGELVRITQVGTGNYNESTAAHYTDLSLITADTDIAADAENVFEALCAGRLPDGAYSLLVSPISLKERVLALIDEEIAAADSGTSAYFGAKLNGLTDRDIIAKLIEASRRGVKIELIVRGICCLRPSVAGYTDNIRVVSIVGRYLEHARIYISGSGLRQRVFISSADLMTRNTRRRVEAAVPIRDKALRKRVTDYFAAQLADTADAWEKLPDGTYARVPCEGVRKSSQRQFMEEQGYTETPSPLPAVQEKAELSKSEVVQAPAPEMPAVEKTEQEKVALLKPEQAPEAPAPTPEEPEYTSPEEPEKTTSTDGADPLSAELPPAPSQPEKRGFFARITSFFRRLAGR